MHCGRFEEPRYVTSLMCWSTSLMMGEAEAMQHCGRKEEMFWKRDLCCFLFFSSTIFHHFIDWIQLDASNFLNNPFFRSLVLLVHGNISRAAELLHMAHGQQVLADTSQLLLVTRDFRWEHKCMRELWEIWQWQLHTVVLAHFINSSLCLVIFFCV